ncbi:hypothetical protein GALMADRAFT_885831 [Galerina marginata CBS 339.88]|uniref:Uncharacterized protein n=1 Tax=Galerina marginata (strain CBS 339.88) TaxID=685588 RepID=A0A067SUQ8_GALM3|nr:hypothetical protein GALMADRAFT_885831 [Galerina marginata CBS 339.88]
MDLYKNRHCVANVLEYSPPEMSRDTVASTIRHSPVRMSSPPSTESLPHFTYDQILYFARLLQQIHGTTLHFTSADEDGVREETIPLPNDIRLIESFQRLHGEDVNPDGKSVTVHLEVAGVNISITRSSGGEEALPRDTFDVTTTPCQEKAASDGETIIPKPEGGQITHEYHVFDDYQTSFVWAASAAGLRDEVLDEDLPSTLTRTLASDLRRWTNVYDSNFCLQGCDLGSGLDIFRTVPEIVTWTTEGAILSIRIAVASSLPVVYSAYLRAGNEYRFVGNTLRDGATLVKLVLRLNKHLTTVRPASPQDGILRLRDH